jgi:hypothetical protein
MPPSYPAGSYPALVVADGASAFWRLGETSGTTAVDVIGAKNGTISGGVTLAQPGALADGDPAMAFDGNVSLIQTAVNLSLVPPFTIEAWVKSTVIEKFFFNNNSRTANVNDLFHIGTSGTKLRVQVYYASSGSTEMISTNRVIVDGNWHHVAVVFQSNLVTGYVDGMSDLTAVPTVALVGSTNKIIKIGYSTSWTGYTWNGSIDEVAIYPTALTAPQIAAHYAAKDWTASTFGPGFSKLEYRWCRYVPSRARR